ncbi:helix-turn-helix domain-containing protein [Microbispora sp. H13382]|uniref:helix-turn-helix transcriptional regulator n=1 Tax=Microbispora sp. H13382 TaxID=2729112 RepID=UPI002873D9E0|nr:helix-turn-helix domain-containing protein [Microbispora sp. H13382]
MTGDRGADIDPRAHRVLADVSRVAVLETLRKAGRPMAIPEIAAAVGLHPNTVRGHLALLVEHGYANGGREDRERPGRPRLLYSATAGPDADERRNYRLLAEVLLTYLSGLDENRGAAAISAGRAYGERTGKRAGSRADEQAPPARTTTGTTAAAGDRSPMEAGLAAATAEIVELLDDAGFDPLPVDDGSRIELRRCPFRELAQADPEVVCGVHLGLMQGALAEMGAPPDMVRLQPFVRPGLCVATLHSHGEHASEETPCSCGGGGGPG